MNYKKEICNECLFWQPADGLCVKRKGTQRRGDAQACSCFRLCELSRRERGLYPLNNKPATTNTTQYEFAF